MAQTDNVTIFPEWLKRAIELGYSPLELARLLGTTPATVAQLIRSVPTRPAELRKLARQLGVDYESFRTFTDNALQPITGFDKETQRLLRLWEKLDTARREALLVVMADMARGRAAKRPATRRKAPSKQSR
jgi:transcriptional regulator with XRE-family HTH domain